METRCLRPVQLSYYIISTYTSQVTSFLPLEHNSIELQSIDRSIDRSYGWMDSFILAGPITSRPFLPTVARPVGRKKVTSSTADN
jgi:hypothetical protein